MRNTGRTVPLAVAAVLAAGTLHAQQPEQPTTMFRGGPAHTGVYAVDAVHVFGGLAWSFRTGGPVRSSPVLSGGLLFVGSDDGYLYALDRQSGALAWRFDAGAAVTSSPAVAHGLVLFQSHGGTLHAVDLATGLLRWQVRTGPDAPLEWGYESGDIYVSSPVVVEGTVVVGGGDGRVYAVDLRDGRVRWRFTTGGRVRSSPAVAGGTVFVGSMDGSLYALDLRSGRLRWRYDTEGRTLRSREYGFDRKTIQSSPAVAEGVVYVGSRDGHLYAVDAGSGRLRWRFDHRVSWVNTSPAVADGIVYAGSSDARFVQGVDAGTGREVWRLRTAGPVWSSPAVAGDVVYFADFTGRLYALDRRSGSLLWTYRGGAGLRSSPVPGDGMLYLGAEDGTVYAIRASDGAAPLARAVFWDRKLAPAAWIAHGEAVRDHLTGRGYELLDAGGLARFMEARVADGTPSVVVFALDHLPREVAAVPSDTVLFRRYLEAGGKVVWLGVPPLLWVADPATGARSYGDIDRDATRRLLGVDHRRANFDPYRTAPTPEGKRWGLEGWWLDDWGVAPEQVTTVLALDENGLATGWVRSYGGPPGTGFVRLWGAGRKRPDLTAVQVAAEYRPRGAPEAGRTAPRRTARSHFRTARPEPCAPEPGGPTGERPVRHFVHGLRPGGRGAYRGLPWKRRPARGIFRPDRPRREPDRREDRPWSRFSSSPSC